MAAASSFKFDAKSLLQGLSTTESKADAAIRMYAETAAVNLEAYMKSNRPWVDRTGNAKARLTASVQKLMDGYRIALAHGVTYGIWLELANEKRYAIIQPTILAKSNEVFEGYEHLLDKLK